MKKILNDQSGLTLIELLLATVILGFVVSGFVLLSGSIVKTNTDSFRDSQSMAYATIISELIKNEYKENSESIVNGAIVTLESTVIDQSSKPNLTPENSIRQEVVIPKQGDLTGFKEIIYVSGEKTGYQYSIRNELKHEQPASDGVPGAKEMYFEMTVIVKNTITGNEKKIVFRHNFENI